MSGSDFVSGIHITLTRRTGRYIASMLCGFEIEL